MKKCIFFLVFASCLRVLSQDVIINDWSKDVLVESSRKVIIKEKKRITILNEDGNEQSLFHSYEDRFSKIFSFSLIVYDKNGNKVKRKGKAELQEYIFNSSDEIDDTKSIFLDPEYQNYPYTIEYEVERRYNNGFLTLPNWYPVYSFRTTVEKASFSIKKPVNYELNYLTENTEEPDHQIMDEYDVYRWSVSDLAPVDNDISYKQFIAAQPKVRLTPVKFMLDGTTGSYENWSAFGDWYLSLNSDPYSFGEETKNFLDNVNNQSSVEVINQLYSYLQQKNRYISIQLGIGGFKSFPVDFVDKNGYGDCKALSTYMKAMLDYKGIKSNYILVNAGKEVEDLNKEFVSYQFNHVFLGVPMEKDTVLLECTDPMFPSGFIGSFTDDRYILWIEENNSKLIRSLTYEEHENQLETKGTVEIDKYGNGVLNLEVDKKGFFYEDLYLLESMSENQYRAFVANSFDFRDFTIDQFDHTLPSKDSARYLENQTLIVNNLVKNTGDRLLIPYKLLPSADSYFRYNRFKRFGEIRRAFTLVDNLRLVTPEGYTLRIPEEVSIRDSYGEFMFRVEKNEDNSYNLFTKTILKKGLYLEQDFEQFSEFFKKVKRAERTKLILEKRT